MSKWPADFKKYVLDDIENYKDKRVITKAGLIERYATRFVSPDKIHPNPVDEFTHEDVGPNFGIVSNYATDIRTVLEPNQMDIFREPLIVEKMEPDGYLLLNGHHRWFAALRMGVKKVRVKVVNLVHEEDVERMLGKNQNTKRVSFDLDEVLLTAAESMQAPVTDGFFSKRIKERLRIGAPEVIRAFQDAGYDVWVYTAGYNSEEYITDLFSMYEITVDGIANGINEKRGANAQEIKAIREKMAQKYSLAVHVDDESVLLIDTNDCSYDQYAIADKSEDWAEGVIAIIKEH